MYPPDILNFEGSSVTTISVEATYRASWCGAKTAESHVAVLEGLFVSSDVVEVDHFMFLSSARQCVKGGNREWLA